MSRFRELNQPLRQFVERQRMFFVATAAADGRVNVSPKGLDTLRILSNTRIAWLSLSGSGNETAAHVIAVPRMTLMFCAFDGAAMIVRIYGTARVIYPQDGEWEPSLKIFPVLAGSRQIFHLDIDLVQTSCGTGVPEMSFVRDRGPDELLPFYAAMDEAKLRDYWKRKNVLSIDGKPTAILPGGEQDR